MAENRDSVAAEMSGDVELLIRFLNRQLDPDRDAAVRKRLEEDPAFLEFATPLLVAWSVPDNWERHPIPPGDAEKAWDKFTKAGGFLHQRRKTRRRRLWMLAIVAAVVGISGFLLRGKVRAEIADRRDYEQVAYDTGWIRLLDGSEVLMSPGARLRALKRYPGKGMRVKLLGSARFRSEPPDTSENGIPELQTLIVQTRGSIVMAASGEFSVTARGDTTDVEVHPPRKRQFVGVVPLPTFALLSDGSNPKPFKLDETESARVVRGTTPVKLTSTTTVQP